MTVQELIDKLKAFKPDLQVVTPAYEFGCDDLENVAEIAVAQRDERDESWWSGKYREGFDSQKTVVLLSGKHYYQ